MLQSHLYQCEQPTLTTIDYLIRLILKRAVSGYCKNQNSLLHPECFIDLFVQLFVCFYLCQVKIVTVHYELSITFAVLFTVINTFNVSIVL